MAHRQCRRRLWLALNAPEAAAPPDAGSRSRMESGQAFGEAVRTRFPGGVLVTAGPSEYEVAERQTRAAMEGGAPAVFEAAFSAEGLHVRCDVLVREGTGWRIVEAKTATTVREEHQAELAFQAEVLRRTGVEVVGASLAIVDRDVVRSEEPLSLVDLVRLCPVQLEEVDRAALLDGIADAFRVADLAAMPEAVVGPGCKSPSECPFMAHCRIGQADTDVETLPRIGQRAVVAFREAGIDRIEDIPAGTRLNSTQERVVRVVRFGGPEIDPSLASALESVSFPACFVDFEAAQPLLPMFPGMRPFSAVPFQWSCHRLESPDGEAEHTEFLDTSGRDPRPGFVASLAEALDGAATVVVYSSYERTRLKALADEGVPGAAGLLAMFTPREFDLLPVVTKGVYAREFRGSFSIKAVLPALVPGLGYADLAIKGGEAANTAYLDIVSGRIAGDEAEATRRALLAYCERDTLAMVELFRALRRLAGLGI